MAVWSHRGGAAGRMPLARLQPGDHVCVPGLDARQVAAGLAAYVAGGLRDQQRVVILADDPSTMAATLATQVAGCCAAMERGQVLVRDRRQGYLTSGVFDTDRLLSQLVRTVDTAGAAGYAGLRVTGRLVAAGRCPSQHHRAGRRSPVGGAVGDGPQAVVGCGAGGPRPGCA